MFTSSSDGDQRKNSLSHSLSISVNEPRIGLEEFSRVRSNKMTSKILCQLILVFFFRAMLKH